ncbi:MAG TPA: hypothetical protein VGN16_12650 [Acidobacteriaceae bacterium]
MPAKPNPTDTAYSATPLPKKLGLVLTKARPLNAAIVGAPEGFLTLLGDLPEYVTIQPRITPETQLALCFVRTLRDVDAVMDMLAAKLPLGASAWIIRPKTHHKPGFNENDVREAGLAIGLVDYKICSVDADWSGIKFAWRKTAK